MTQRKDWYTFELPQFFNFYFKLDESEYGELGDVKISQEAISL